MTPFGFLSRIMMIDVLFPFSVTSYKRSRKHNATVGGHPRSRHQLWVGCDVVLDDPGDTDDFIHEAKRLGLLAIDERNHIHIQPGGDG